jgi:predicted dehydrogenase
MTTRRGRTKTKRIRYAVVGLGHIAQASVLPAFRRARENSVLTTVVSSDPAKREELTRQYGLERAWTYDEYDRLLESGDIDAVFIALPNDMHADFTIRALNAGVSVLCEKPMAVTSDECARMIAAAGQAQLMIAYRLHLEEATLTAIERVRSGILGEPRFFTSTFSMQVKPDDIRLDRSRGGGPLYDIGIYCVNAARHLFQDEPTEIFAASASSADRRFEEIDEMISATLRFPQNRLATFVCSFGAASVGSYRVVGTAGSLRVEPAYEYAGALTHYLTIDGETKKTVFRPRDQFASELSYFSDCILEGKRPQPSGEEGLADVQIIEALLESAESRRPLPISVSPPPSRPTLEQSIRKPAATGVPKLVRV